MVNQPPPPRLELLAIPEVDIVEVVEVEENVAEEERKTATEKN